MNAPVRENYPGHATKQTEHGGFAQQLTNDPGSPGAERRSHGNLAGARSRTRKKQIGDIGAGDQQHEPDGA